MAAELHSIEVCAGAGGTALGLEASFSHQALVEIDAHACETLRLNRPEWKVCEEDVNLFDPTPYKGVDLLSGGVPCPPFSVAGKGLGADDERDLFPAMMDLTDAIRPRAVMIENVPGIMRSAFDTYRETVDKAFLRLGYVPRWTILQASDFGVSQLRPRVVMVAMEKGLEDRFEWPEPHPDPPPTVGELLRDEMASNGWEGVDEWAKRADDIAPTLVGGSKKHGGPDLGPTRAKRAWADLGVDAHVLGNEPPPPGFSGMPRLTVQMAAMVQGFPREWKIAGRKTPAYRQVGNAFPPPVAEAVGKAIAAALR